MEGCTTASAGESEFMSEFFRRTKRCRDVLSREPEPVASCSLDRAVAAAATAWEVPNIAGVGMGGSGFRADGVLYISQVNTRGHSGGRLATGLHEVRRGEANESKVKIASREVRLC